MSRSRKKKSGNFFSILIWIIIVAVFIFNKINDPEQVVKTENPRNQVFQKKTPEEVKQVNKKLNLAIRLENNKKYTEANEVFNSAVEDLRISSIFTNQFKSDVWALKTDFHLRLWQHADAKMSLDVVEKANKERDENSSYVASPNVGPAAKFMGEIGIVHLFVEEKTGQSWGLKQRTISLTAMDKAKEWFKKETTKYGKSVNFKQRVYLINRNPAIKRLSLGTDKKRYRYAQAIVKLAVKQLGNNTILSFLNKNKKEMQVQEVMLMVHINKSGRSFAKRCLFQCASTGEYTFILEDAAVKKWQSMEYAQAHESLHLFGAADLYNIKQSAYFATRDIMNYPSRYLDANVIEPITAYGIGLINEKPVTPFKIKRIKY